MNLQDQILNNNSNIELKPKMDLMKAVSDQVAIDLNQRLSSAAQIKNRIRILSEKIEIDKKTLARLMSKKSIPNYVTVFKIYRYLLNETNDAVVIEKAPSVIREYLKKRNPVTFDKKVSYTAQIDQELRNNPVFMDIYVLCSTSAVSKHEVEKRYGQYGQQVVEKMLKLGIIALTKKSEYVIGLNQTTLTPETLLNMGLKLTERYAKPTLSYELDNNIIGFYAEGLSEEAYQAWIKIDNDAMKKKIAIAEKPEAKGPRRSFTFVITDTLEIEEKE